MKITGIIPARMGSSRFPGKPLAQIKGKAMIWHVYQRSRLSHSLDDVYMATPDDEIKEYCEKNNMKVIMTKDTHERASDRAAEAMLKIENQTKQKIDILVMIQGDEPLVYPEMIDLAVKPLAEDKNILVSNLTAPLKSIEEFEDPNEVKVVTDKKGFALYFSREPIPSLKKYDKEITMLKQVCIIPFKRDFLLEFNDMEQTPLEIIESVDMLRCLENRYEVKLIHSKFNTYSVDTIEDLKRVEKRMEEDCLYKDHRY